MKISVGRAALGALALAAPLAAPAVAMAAPASGPQARLARIEAQLAEQDARLKAQARQLEAQRVEIEAQGARLVRIGDERDRLLDRIRAAGLPADAPRLAEAASPPAVEPVLPDRPVGEAPPERRVTTQVAALPENVGVLTPRGRFILEPSAEYVRSSSNRLVFRGVEIVPGVQLGVIEADNADRDTLVGALSAYYGVTDRLEVQARIPYVYRRDRVTTLAQRDATVTRSMTLEGRDIGDVEVSARYQINDVRPGRPVFVGNLRVKPPTGRGPFDVSYDEFGVATDLATGSGFWGVEGGVTMLYPTDPAVIFGSLNYLHNIARNIDKTIGDVPVGKVDPGDSIGLSLGFGLALNPRFSVSLGYSHNYIFPTHTELGGTTQSSQPLQVGSLLMGWSFRFSDRLTLSNNFEFGVTTDAPDMRVVFRAPYRF